MAKADILRGLVVAGEVLGTVNRVNRAVDNAHHELEKDRLRMERDRARRERDAAQANPFGSLFSSFAPERSQVDETRDMLKSKIAQAKIDLIDAEEAYGFTAPYKVGEMRQKIRKLERALRELDY